MKFNSDFDLEYTKDLRERPDLFEVSVSNKHKFTYTYEIKSSQILLIQLKFE